jgi:hypothetical protein
MLRSGDRQVSFFEAQGQKLTVLGACMLNTHPMTVDIDEMLYPCPWTCMRRVSSSRRPENDIEDGVLLLLASTHFYFFSFALGMKSPVLAGFLAMYYSLFLIFNGLKELNVRFYRRAVDSQTTSEASSEADEQAEADNDTVDDDNMTDKTDPDMPKLVPHDYVSDAEDEYAGMPKLVPHDYVSNQEDEYAGMPPLVSATGEISKED